MRLNLQNSELKITAGELSQFPFDSFPQIALAGRSNAGKSSLVNSLLGRKSLARVSSSPGKTITINFYNVDEKLYIVDLPGYGYAKRSAEEQRRWSILTDGYFTENPNIDKVKLVIQLVDHKIGPTDNDKSMLDYLVQTGLPHIIVAAKADRLNSTERKRGLELIKKCPSAACAGKIIPYSAKTGEGRDELWNLIAKSAMLD